METQDSINNLTREDLITILHQASGEYAVLLMRYEMLEKKYNELSQKQSFLNSHKIKIKGK